MKVITRAYMESVPVASWRQLGNVRQATALTEQLEPGTLYPIVQHMFHEGGVPRIRATVAIADRFYQCDFQVDVFNSMGEVRI